MVPLFAFAMLSAGSVDQRPDASLDFFLGSWRCDGHFEPSKRSIASVLEFRRDPDVGSLVKRHDDIAPGRYRAVERWDYVPSQRLFRSAISDSGSGMRWYTSAGWVGSQLTWSRTSIAGERKDQFIYRKTGDRSMQVDWLVDRGAGLTIGDTLTCVRGENASQ